MMDIGRCPVCNQLTWMDDAYRIVPHKVQGERGYLDRKPCPGAGEVAPLAGRVIRGVPK
jgi:hypothetical protein